MATWSAVESVTGTPIFVTFVGTKIYWATRLGSSTGGEDIYEYNTETDTTTKIIEYDNITDLDAIAGLCGFNGDLYVYAIYNTVTPFQKVFKVERWDGVVDSLTTVDTVATHTYTSAAPGGRMYADSDQLIATFIAGATESGTTCRVSTNGSSWTTATFDITPHHPTGTKIEPFPYASHHPTILHEGMCTSNTIGSCTTSNTFAWGGSSWSSIDSPASPKYYQGIVGTNLYWVTTGSRNYTEDFVSTTTAGGDAAAKSFQVNMPWHPGILELGGSSTLFQFDGANWVSFESMGAFAFIAPSDDTMVRTSDENVFYVGFDNNVGNFRIVKRSEPIVTIVEGAQLYYGINSFQDNQVIEV